jgi:hypothetical protein
MVIIGNLVVEAITFVERKKTTNQLQAIRQFAV